MKPDPNLRSEVEYARAARLPVRNQDVRWVLVGRIDYAACSLNPWRKTPSGGKIPTQNDGRNAEPGIGSTAVRKQRITRLAVEYVVGFVQSRRRRERLPVRNQLARILELSS